MTPLPTKIFQISKSRTNKRECVLSASGGINAVWDIIGGSDFDGDCTMYDNTDKNLGATPSPTDKGYIIFTSSAEKTVTDKLRFAGYIAQNDPDLQKLRSNFNPWTHP